VNGVLVLGAAFAISCGRIGFDAVGTGGGGDDGAHGDGIVLPHDTNIAFVTSIGVQPYTLGGLAGADMFCNTRAAAAQLPGTYVAWLSTSTVNAVDRLAGSRGWVRADGRPFVDTVAELVAGKMFYPLSVDEFGNAVPVLTDVETATLANGMYAGGDCVGYTSLGGTATEGFAVYATLYWTLGNQNAPDCGSLPRLYCFGTGMTTPVRPAAPSGRRAFLVPAWNPGGGIASADTACQTAATGASLAGMYRALLPTTGTTAISRFDLGGPMWQRADGADLAASTADLAAGQTLTALNYTADGTLVSTTNIAAWTGGMPNATGTDLTTCSSWTNNTTGNGRTGNYVATGSNAFDDIVATICSSVNFPIYCLQQ
jgi:hypothetical protein